MSLFRKQAQRLCGLLLPAALLHSDLDRADPLRATPRSSRVTDSLDHRRTPASSPSRGLLQRRRRIDIGILITRAISTTRRTTTSPTRHRTCSLSSPRCGYAIILVSCLQLLQLSVSAASSPGFSKKTVDNEPLHTGS